MWDYPVCITSLCQKRKIFPFLAPHLGKHEQQHYHKALRHMQFPFSKHSDRAQPDTLWPGRSTAETSAAHEQGGQHRDELGQAAELSKTLLCSIHSAVSKGAAQQDSCLHVKRKRPISVQQQIIGILCNFIPAFEDC